MQQLTFIFFMCSNLKGDLFMFLLTKFYGYFAVKSALCLAGYVATVFQGAPSSTLLTVGLLSAAAGPLFYVLGE
jgi:hypothetical protein